MAAESEAQATDNLALKKKARRRLVGTVALVILSLLILPQILKNKSQPIASEEPVLIMPEQAQVVPEPEAPEVQAQTEQSATPVNQSGFSTEAIAENLANEYGDEKPEVAEQKPVEKASDTKSEKAVKLAENEKAVVKENSAKVQKDQVANTTNETAKEAGPRVPNKVVQKSETQVKNVVTKAKEKIASQQKSASKPVKQAAEPAASAAQSRYAVQLGVFADPNNVKKMQAKIALAGFESKTSSVSKGTRLRVGYFVSRQGAEQALETLKQNGLSGKVVAR